MVRFCISYFLYVMVLSVQGLKLWNLAPIDLQTLSTKGVPLAVSVSNTDLHGVASSVLLAESWVKTHVLTHFPATNITAIVVGNTLLCNREYKERWGLVLPSVKNIFYSLVRWGLEKEIKVSAAFSTDCFEDHLAEKVIEPLMEFLQSSNSTYTVNPHQDLSPFSDKTVNSVSAYSQSGRKLEFVELQDINLMNPIPEQKKPISRKLSFMNSKITDLPPPSIHSNINGFFVPAKMSNNPLPPLMGITPSPSISFSFAPKNPPVVVPSNPPDVFTFPPCNPVGTGAPTPETGEEKGLWCVAKPSVPAYTLQEAMDYACGEGGADCDEIMPQGSCYYPDTAVAHASYAFNSYWQKNKNNGGTCSFGGTALIINADPSFMDCRFIPS